MGMLASCIYFTIICVYCNPGIFAQKLIVIIVDGLSGSSFHKFEHLSGFQTFQENGVWSTLLYPEFPTLSLPNRQTIMTDFVLLQSRRDYKLRGEYGFGVSPNKHGFVGDYMYNWSTGRIFHNFEQSTDLNPKLWWRFEPIYITAQKAGAPTALFYFPECEVAWQTKISICVPPGKHSEETLGNKTTVMHIIETTNTHDLVIVNYVGIRRLIQKNGLAGVQQSEVLSRFAEALEYFQANIQDRIDLNLLVISPHGYIDVPTRNIRILDNYIPMDLINNTIGYGAVKQIIGYPGKTHQIYSQLRYISPIPNIKIYYTAANIGDIPAWYHYRKSERIPDLVLVAAPGYAIYTRDEKKQIPKPSKVQRRKALSGYNNHYPDMLGMFLAYGPLFQKGMRKGPLNLVDVYEVMCMILRLHCPRPTINITNIDDILITKDLDIELLEAKIPILSCSACCSFKFKIHTYFLLFLLLLRCQAS